MKTRRFLVAILILHPVTACDNDASDASSVHTADSRPTPTPESSAETPEPEAAVAVIREYYAAVDSGAYRRAYLLWGDSGRMSQQSFEQFRTGFVNTASVEVHVDEPGRIEGAAGSRYIQIPVRIEALTKSGARQQFAGTYTLRRALVEGASTAHRDWHIYSASISPCQDVCPDVDAVAAEVEDVIRRFGTRLRMTSLLGPRDAVVSSMREHYAPLVTPDLLAEWIRDPSAAPGRRVSSPWPQQIDVADVRREGEDVRVARGHIIYVTSVDTMSAVDEVPVAIRLLRGPDRVWRISEFLQDVGRI